MKKTILMLCLSLSLLSSYFFKAPKVYASTLTKNVSSNLQKNDLTKISNLIDEVISSNYKVMKTWNLTNYSNLIKDPVLLDYISKKNNLALEWFKTGNIKINDYKSTTKIDNIIKETDNKYIANISYGVKFKINNSNTSSESTNEKFRAEIIYQNNKWYITKLLDLDVTNANNNSNKDQSKNKLNTLSLNNESNNDNNFSNYDNIINSQIASVEDVSNNINKYIDEFKPQNNTNNIKLMSASYSGYNSSGAVSYAHKYYSSYNPNYIRYSSDCTNFVSQCAYEGGGIPSRTLAPAWVPAKKNSIVVAIAWTSVKEFYSFMTSMGYASSPSDGCKTARLGDIVQYYNKSKQDWTHSAIITKIDSSGMYYSSHTKDRIDYPTWNPLLEGTYSNIRLIKFWH
jgi:hypothetical protein